MIRSALHRKTTVTDAVEWNRREKVLLQRLLPYLEQQPGYRSHELRRDGEAGGMVQVTEWETSDHCRAYLRNGAAALAATWLEAFFPTAPFPDGNWIRETVEV